MPIIKTQRCSQQGKAAHVAALLRAEMRDLTEKEKAQTALALIKELAQMHVDGDLKLDIGDYHLDISIQPDPEGNEFAFDEGGFNFVVYGEEITIYCEKKSDSASKGGEDK